MRIPSRFLQPRFTLSPSALAPQQHAPADDATGEPPHDRAPNTARQTTETERAADRRTRGLSRRR